MNKIIFSRFFFHFPGLFDSELFGSLEKIFIKTLILAVPEKLLHKIALFSDFILVFTSSSLELCSTASLAKLDNHF